MASLQRHEPACLPIHAVLERRAYQYSSIRRVYTPHLLKCERSRRLGMNEPDFSGCRHHAADTDRIGSIQNGGSRRVSFVVAGRRSSRNFNRRHLIRQFGRQQQQCTPDPCPSPPKWFRDGNQTFNGAASVIVYATPYPPEPPCAPRLYMRRRRRLSQTEVEPAA